MHLCVDIYVILWSWCTWYGAMQHVAMQCTKFYGTSSLNPWFMSSNFSELSKNARYRKTTSKWRAQNGKPPQFRIRGNMVGLKDDNPRTSKEDANWKSKLTILTLSSGGKKFCHKGQLCVRAWSVAWQLKNFLDGTWNEHIHITIGGGGQKRIKFSSRQNLKKNLDREGVGFVILPDWGWISNLVQRFRSYDFWMDM
jgi:hypothetical protein